MVNNYPSDPKNALPASNSGVSQNGPGDRRSELPQSPPSPPSPNGGQFATPGSSAGSGGYPGGTGSNRLASGTLLSGGRYKIEKLVASGGMGAVYRALDTRFNRPCAVKEMLDEFRSESERAQAVEWFSREATLLLDLNHPCIPRVRDFFAESGRHYLVMDFIEGRTLAEVMDQEGNVLGVNGARGVTEARVRSWAQQLCSVLSYLHRQSPPIIFRDLKPSNIMVTGRDEIKLIDFGIARTFQSQRQSTIIMTLGYAPPEQLHGMPEPRSDLYALGATMHRVLTRHDAANNKPTVFSFPPVRTLRPDISPTFEQVLVKALSPSLEQRWPSAAEMERALINLPPVTAAPPVAGPGPVAATLLAPGQISATPAIPLTPMTPSVASASGTPSSGPAPATRTGPAGPYITAAQSHLASTPARVNEAYEAVKMAFGLEPNNALVHRIFGQVFARRMPPQPDLALQAYNRSLQLNSEDAETHKLLGDVWLFLRQQPYQGIPAYTQAVRLNPNDFESHERLGMCYDRTNQLESALREYQEAVRLAATQPQNVQLRLYFSLGQAAWRLKQFPVAEHAFVQVLILDPASHDTRFLLSQVYEQENKWDEAFRECSYVVGGPLGPTPAVQQMYQRLRARLGR
ncbi:MAG TPA: protein kinase [Ktedonobacteraceae bacterium]|nr:protein kinase [Ktedonobacteraceae bacterium]